MKRLFAHFVALEIVALLHTQGVNATVLVSLAPPLATFTKGDAVNVDVSISGLGNPPSVGAFDLNVGFDPALLSPTAVLFGPFLGDPDSFEALAAFDFPTSGIVESAEVSLLSPSDLDALQSSNFLLATLSFTAKSSGTSAFTFVGTPRVDDAFGNRIPEPTTVALLAVGLAGLGLARRRRLC